MCLRVCDTLKHTLVIAALKRAGPEYASALIRLIIKQLNTKGLALPC